MRTLPFLRDPRYLFQLIFVIAVYFVAGKLGLKLAFVNPSATPIWAPTGIAMAVLLLGGYRFVPAIFLGAYLVNITTAGGFLASLGIALGNTLEGIIGAFVIQTFAGGKQVFEKVQHVIAFTLLSAFASTTVSATIGFWSLFLTKNLDIASARPVWITWWLGDATGALLVVPLVVLWTTTKQAWKRNYLIETSILFLLLIFVSRIVFTGTFPFAYLCMPVLMWIALRLSPREVTTSVFVLSLIALVHTLNGQGPFADSSNWNRSLLLSQIFMGTAAVMSLIVSALVAERSRDEAAIIQEKAQDDALLESIGDGIVATDREGDIILVNKTFEDLLGWKEYQVLGKRTSQIFPIQDDQGKTIPDEKRMLARAVEEKKKITSTHYLVRKDGTTFPALVVAAPVILSGKIIGAIEVFHDITKEKEIDKEKTEFVSLASHQLRTPVSIIKWYIELLSEKTLGTMSDKQKQYIKEIHKASDRMGELVSALLTTSRLEAGATKIKLARVNIKQAVRRELDEFAPLITQKSLRVDTSYSKDCPATFQTDEELLHVILQNLFSNAIRYTRDHGTVHITFSVKGKHLMLEVKDNGYGIPAGEQSKIFTKMYRGSNIKSIDQQGTGLGLYMVKSMVKKMNGSIHFESKENKGSVFTVSLPFSKSSPKS